MGNGGPVRNAGAGSKRSRRARTLYPVAGCVDDKDVSPSTFLTWPSRRNNGPELWNNYSADNLRVPEPRLDNLLSL
jgi:hypothetical protein